MAGTKTDYLEDAILRWRMGYPMPTPPGTMYVALMAEPPTTSGGGVEVSGNSYKRQPVEWQKDGNRITNVNQIRFPPAVPAGYSVRGVAIFDAPEGGHMTDIDATVEADVAIGGSFVVDPDGLMIVED